LEWGEKEFLPDHPRIAPHVTAFDPKQYISGKQEADWDTLLSTTRRFSPWQIAGAIIGILLIVWGVWMGLKEARESK